MRQERIQIEMVSCSSSVVMELPQPLEEKKSSPLSVSRDTLFTASLFVDVALLAVSDVFYRGHGADVPRDCFIPGLPPSPQKSWLPSAPRRYYQALYG